MKHRSIAAGLTISGGVLGALAASGCSLYAPPALEVAGARLGEQSPQGVVMNFTLDADNINADALPLLSVRYTVWLNGRAVFTGYRSPEATVRRFGSQQITLPAVVSLADGQPRPTGRAEYRVEGTMEYVTPGGISRILYDAEIERPTVQFSMHGEIDLGA